MRNGKCRHSVDMRNISNIFIFIFKTKKITTNDLMLFQYYIIFKTIPILLFFIEKCYSSTKITYISLKTFLQFFEDILTFQIPWNHVSQKES